jgi:hypothetical protein
MFSRIGKRWNINECLNLQREFELLTLSIEEIAIKHKRTPNAIMCKLHEEGLADYNVLYNKYYVLKQNEQVEYNSINDSESDTVSAIDDTFNDVDSVSEVARLRQQVAVLQKHIDTLTNILVNNKNIKTYLY